MRLQKSSTREEERAILSSNSNKELGFTHDSAGKSYFYKGDPFNGLPAGYGIFKCNKGKYVKVGEVEEWQNDKIEICLNCENWTLSFQKNGKMVFTVGIEKGIKYYPALSFCGEGDIKVTM